MQQEPEVRMNVAQSRSKKKIQELQNGCEPYLKRNVGDKIEKIFGNQDESCSHQDIFIAKQGKSVPIFDDFEVIDDLSLINNGGKRENKKQDMFGGTIKWSETGVCPEADIHCRRTSVSSNKVWIEMDKGEEKADLMEDKNSNFVKINRKENVLIHAKERVEDYVENCFSSENITEIPFGEAGVQPIHLCKDDFVHVVERTKCKLNLEKPQVCVEKSDPFGSGICKRSLHNELDNNDDKEGNKRSKIVPIIDHGDHTDLRKGTRSFNVSNSICMDILLILLLLPSFVMSSYTREENDTVCSQQLRSRSASNEMIDYQKESSRRLLQKDYSSYEVYLGFLSEKRWVTDVLFDTCLSFGVSWDVEFDMENMEGVFYSFDHESWEKVFSPFYEEHLEMRTLKLRKLTEHLEMGILKLRRLTEHLEMVILKLRSTSIEDVLFPYFDDCCSLYNDDEEYNIKEPEEYDTPVVENVNVYQHWMWGFSAEKNQRKQKRKRCNICNYKKKIKARNSKASFSEATVYIPLAPDLKSKLLLDLSQLKAFSQDVPQRKKSSKKKRTDGDTSQDLCSYMNILYRVFCGIGFIVLTVEFIVSSIYGRQFLFKKVLDLEPWEILVEFVLPRIVILAALVGHIFLVVRAKLCHMEWESATRILNSFSYRRSQVCYFSRRAIYRIWRFLLSTGKCFAGFAKNILFWMTKMIFRKATAIDYKLLFMQISDVSMILIKVMKKLFRMIIVIIEAVGKEYQLNDFDECENETKLYHSCSDTFKPLNTDDAEYNEFDSHCKLCETTEYKERCSTENKGVQVNLINVGLNTTEFQSSCQGQISATEMSNNSCDPTVTYSSIGNEEIIHMKSKEGSTYTDKDGKVKIDIISNNMIDATNHDTTLQDSCKNNYNSDDEKMCFVSASIGNHDNRNETEHFVSPNDLEYDSLRNEEKNKFYKKEKIMLRDLSLSSSVTTEHHNVLPNNDIHAETAVKEIYVDPDDSSYMNVELTDSVELSIDEFNNSERRHCVGKTAKGSAVQMCTDNAENESIHSSRSSEMEDYTEQTNNDVDSLHEDYNTTRCNSKIWSLLSYNKFCLENDTELCNSMKSDMSDMESNSLKVDKSFSSSLHSGSCSSCLTDTHVYNCQFEIQHHSGPQLILDYKDDIQPASSTVIDLQKRQELKSQSLEKQTKPSMNEQEKKVTMRDDEIREHVKNTITNLVGEAIPKVTKRLKSGKRCSKRCRKAAGKRMSRRRLRRILYPLGNICNVKTDIEARPHLNVPQTNAASNRHARELDAAAAVALPRSVLTTSLPSTTNSLNSYFTKMISGHEFSTEEKMQYEMLRVQSFQDLPASCRVSPLRLARTGFFSTGISDEVNCFSCGVRYKGWQGGDNPSEIHRRISPDCRMVNGRETRNIPAIPPSNGIIESSAHQESLANSSIGLVQTTIHPDGDMSTQTVSNRALTREEIQNGNVADTTLQSRNAIQQPFANQQYTRQPAIDRSHSVTEGEQNRPAHRDTAEELGITLDRPKYPAYAQLNVRVSTFQGWPGYLDQTPRDMALAGFFYAGYNDYCRCFFCGGGLRNWDAGDDPWVEHARWFSKCAFVRQNRGHRFVEIIVKRQAEMEAAGNTSGSASSHTSVTHSETESRNQTTAQAGAQSGEKSSTNDPAVESVKEIGYSDEIIQRAISIIRQSNPGKERIEATEILEIIFTIADDNNTQTNAAVPSDNTPASTLNLPGQQVSQPNVSSVPVSTQSSASNQRPGVPSQSGNAAESSLPSLSVSSLELGNAGSKSEQSGAGKEISENDIRSLQEENIQLKEQVMCKICMDKNVSIAFLPCGHLACCIDCAPAMRKCPMCRVYIKGTVKTYLA